MKTYLIHPKIQMQMNEQDRTTKSVDVYFIKGQEVAHANVMYQILLPTRGCPEHNLLISSLTGKRYNLDSEKVVNSFADHHVLNESGGNAGKNYRDCGALKNSTERHTKRATIILRSELEGGKAKLTISPAAAAVAATTTTRRSANSSLRTADQRALARQTQTVVNSNQLSELKQELEQVLKQQVEAFKQELSQKIAERNATDDVLKQELKQEVKREIESLRQHQREEWKRENESLWHQMEELKRENESLRHGMEELKRENESLRHGMEELKREQESLRHGLELRNDSTECAVKEEELTDDEYIASQWKELESRNECSVKEEELTDDE